MSRNADIHNAHMLLPKELWDRARELARLERTTVTALVVEGLRHVIDKRARRRA